MAYKNAIATEVRQLIKDAPDGYSEYVLEHFVQQDVADTVNAIRSEYPGDTLQETDVYMTGTAPVCINK
ncbi:hypothetical protein [Edaphobacillus lindanitolerans]|uniref:Uncharacterized protein n=1 Tax=Edaphobacillus lindanitolerans TaxID=550447 RepID=A0A1U7PSS3_9BACI|nr:hypothetical protein [Edaphobacillus lindanitolerans]SIT91499.1 hypothetical protein SAMN05428946_2692 [Edaphobacillus lindanitolerans]